MELGWPYRLIQEQQSLPQMDPTDRVHLSCRDVQIIILLQKQRVCCVISICNIDWNLSILVLIFLTVGIKFKVRCLRKYKLKACILNNWLQEIVSHFHSPSMSCFFRSCLFVFVKVVLTKMDKLPKGRHQMMIDEVYRVRERFKLNSCFPHIFPVRLVFTTPFNHSPFIHDLGFFLGRHAPLRNDFRGGGYTSRTPLLDLPLHLHFCRNWSLRRRGNTISRAYIQRWRYNGRSFFVTSLSGSYFEALIFGILV